TGTALSNGYNSTQSGWYLQAVYQFMPSWRLGLRRDHLRAGSPDIFAVSSHQLTADDFPRLQKFDPSKDSLMLDYSPSEFSCFRLQLAADHSQPDVTNHEIILQYVMSLGAHGAHTF
ncbi:MAG TPA: hypothetical protein VFM46_16785, partial [Pseudomonadales bacterium]|nr:hypothetical protein [Pseudomonadales bacterium]